MHDQDEPQELLRTAVEACRAGGEVLCRTFRQGGLEVRAKSEHDFVSAADHESEARVTETVLRRFPDHRFLAEEQGVGGGGGEVEWLIDPLDGTSNFLQGLPFFAVSVACRRGGVLQAAAILDPLGENLFTAARGQGAFWNDRRMRVSARPGLRGAFLATGYPFNARRALDLYLDIFRDVFLAARGIRRCGSAALDLAYTAAGVYDGFFEFRLAPWDIAAGALLLREAGGTITDLDGADAFLDSGNVIAGCASLQAELLAVVRGHADEARLEEVDPRRSRDRNRALDPIVG